MPKGRLVCWFIFYLSPLGQGEHETQRAKAAFSSLFVLLKTHGTSGRAAKGHRPPKDVGAVGSRSQKASSQPLLDVTRVYKRLWPPSSNLCWEHLGSARPLGLYRLPKPFSYS